MTSHSSGFARTFVVGAFGLVLLSAQAGCSDDHAHAAAPGAPDVSVSYAQCSPNFRDLPQIQASPSATVRSALRPFAGRGVSAGKHAALRDAVLGPAAPPIEMAAPILNFKGQADVSGVAPPDPNGAVGPNHYVQTVNLNTEIWKKDGTVALASRATRLLWTGYTCTNAGCGCSTHNDGDPVVLYDQLADRWVISQFSLPNTGKAGGPSFQCVAVSKTADPTGAYSLYDFKYAFGINDYGKLGVWPDGYYANFNMFDAAGSTDAYKGDDFCVYDRAKMLAGLPATQQCFFQAFPANTATCPTDGSTPPVQPFAVAGALPVSVDGKIPPPLGAPAYFAQFDYSQCTPPYNQLDLWALHVDWTTPANSTLTGPTAITVADFTPTCYFMASGEDASCIPEPGNSLLDGLDDRLMFRLTYRNFGSHESLLLNHSVAAQQTATAVTQGGVRWYEIRLPGGTPTLFQQGTYAPSDSKWRWMASIAQDQAQDIGLGFSVSNATTNPAIAWTGRLVNDEAGAMGQGETIVDTGTSFEKGGGRWGDYSNLTVDPADDCTFWYTQMVYDTKGANSDWQTYIADFKFPNCGANDFTVAVAPATQNLKQGGSVDYTVTTTSSKGTAETIGLYVQNLPAGVTGTFNPPSVTAGATSTLTLTATATAAAGTATFTVIGKAPSAVHAATAQVTVTTCTPVTTCPQPDNCGTIPNGCGGTVTCGPDCAAPQTCGGGGTLNVCGCTPTVTTCPPGSNCGTIPNGCGGTVTCGPDCTAPQTCGGGGTVNVCGCTPITTCPQGSNCGTIPNGCGGTVTCGPDCTAPQTCGGGGTVNVCGCTPITTCPQGSNCGTIPNGCGGTVTCGPDCSSPQTCGGGGVANVCGCTPKVTACPAGDNCGTVDNGCGGTVSCGTCSGDQMCMSNHCVAPVMDMATQGGGQTGDMATTQNGDMAMSDDMATGAGHDAGTGGHGGSGTGGGGKGGGCGCEVGGADRGTPPAAAFIVILAFAGALLRRRGRSF